MRMGIECNGILSMQINYGTEKTKKTIKENKDAD